MGLQIVTGYTGTAHIKSAHDRTRNAGTVGTGSYVMKTGNMLAAKMQSANTLRIVDGDLMMQGVHATVEAGTHEDLTIDNGTQGKKRNDLVVARYERLAGEPKTESVTLRVIKGEPSDGAAADPAHTEGDILGGDLVAEMPLYRVPIDGITPGDPVALFETVPTIAELRDSVSPASGKAGSVSYFKAAGIVVVSCIFAKVTISSSWGSATIGRLPEGFRPASRVIAPIASDWASGNMSIDVDGTVNINANHDTISTVSSISSIAVFPAA